MKILTKENGTLVYTFTGVTLNSTDSKYIGTILSSYFINLKTIQDTTAKITNGTYTITGGNDGTTDIKDEVVKAFDTLESSNYIYDLLVVPGIYDAAVVSAGLSMCESRGDALYLIDPPSGLTYEGVTDWINGANTYTDHTAFNSSFGACYWAWQYIYDAINDENVLVPPSVLAAPSIARSEKLSKPWFAPAGLTRGLVKNGLSTEHDPDESEVDYLYENNINCIINHETAGLTLWGQKTLWRSDTALNRINVRRLVTYIKRIVKKTCQFLLYEPNDATTWTQFDDLLDPVFRSLVNNRGLYDYDIVPMKYTVSDNDIDNSKMPGQILIKPTKAAEWIPIDVVLTATGVEFTSLVSNVENSVS
jgi:phage tail sheath protein FI